VFHLSKGAEIILICPEQDRPLGSTCVHEKPVAKASSLRALGAHVVWGPSRPGGVGRDC